MAENAESSLREDPIIINSGYRSEAVNKAVGGVKGSNHLTGCAAKQKKRGENLSFVHPQDSRPILIISFLWPLVLRFWKR